MRCYGRLEFKLYSDSHDARYPGIVTIAYQYHPCFGKEIRTTRQFPESSELEIVIGDARQLIPQWMTDQTVCRQFTSSPTARSNVPALVALHQFLWRLKNPPAVGTLSPNHNPSIQGENHETIPPTRGDIGAVRSPLTGMGRFAGTGEGATNPTAQPVDRRSLSNPTPVREALSC